MKKKIGVIGSGIVGITLAKGFAKHGYPVTIATNHPEKTAAIKEKTGGNIPVAGFEETVNGCDVVVLAVKGSAAEQVIKSLAPLLNGKTVIDTTNPIADKPPVNGVLPYFTDLSCSLLEKLQELVPAARIVKAFSCVGNAYMVNPVLSPAPTMFICGDDEGAKEVLKSILGDFGWEYEDLGKKEAARAIEPLAMLWCIPGMTGKGWSHALKLVR
ncbi:MAG: NAD(P)-binding domain-containing protein [Bacteroidia bacterium]|nr:NAD(P)-binding domain-containing protein [Bacteroidia bacterium]